MMSSIDGRIPVAGWPVSIVAGEAYDALHRDLRCDAWLVGPRAMGEYAEGDHRPVVADRAYSRHTWKSAEAGMAPYAIYLDRRGRLHLNRGRVNGDALIAVLTTTVSDHHIAELRRDGISYIFAGEADLDLDLALHILRTEFGIETLLLEGGGTISGAFLGSDLIDEVSLLLLPVADGKPGAPLLFDRNFSEPQCLDLMSVTPLARGVLHLRYRILPQAEAQSRMPETKAGTTLHSSPIFNDPKE